MCDWSDSTVLITALPPTGRELLRLRLVVARSRTTPVARADLIVIARRRSGDQPEEADDSPH